MDVLDSKLAIPNYSRCLIRQDLFDSLDLHFSRASLICIAGGGGYGKTTLVSSYIRARQIPTLWYLLGQGDGNPHTFLTYLLTGLMRLAPYEDHAPVHFPDTFTERRSFLLKTLANWNGPLAIVLDDYHMVDSHGDVTEIILQMIQHSAASVTVILCSKVRPSFPLSRFRAEQQLLEISTEQLSFSRKETKEFFSSLCGVDLEESEINLIHQKTGGWAISFALIVDVIKEKTSEERNRFWSKLLHVQELFDYLGAEVISAQSADIQEFLFKSSLLHELDPEILNQYLEGSHAEQHVDYLLKNHLFVHKSSSGAMHYLSIFRTFLYQNLIKRYGKQYVNDLHVQIGQIYEKRYQFFYAFSHYIAASRFGKASELMKKMMDLFTPERFLFLLDGSVETVSPTFPVVTFSLFLARCLPSNILKNFIKPLEDSINSLLEEGSSSLGLTHLHHRLGLILFYSGNIEEAKGQLLLSLEGSERFHDQRLVSLNLSCLAQCCRFLNEIPEGLEYARRALTNSETYGTTDNLMHTFWIYCELLLEQKDIEKTERIREEIIRLSDSYEDEGARVYPLFAIGKFYRLQGNYEEALAWMMRGLQAAQRSNLNTDMGWACLELGITYLERGDVKQAKSYLEQAVAYFAHYNYFQDLVSSYLTFMEQKVGESLISGETAKQDDFPAKELSVCLLGSFVMKINNESLSLQRKSSLRLFHYLLLQAGKKVPKDILLDELFPDGDYESRKNRFFVSLSTLRKTLEPQLTSGRDSAYVIQTGEFYYLDAARIDLDVEKFVTLVTIRDVPKETRIHNLLSAMKLYRGDLLEEFPYDSFIEPEREKLRHMYIHILYEIALYYWNHKDFSIGMEYFEKLLYVDPYAEQIYYEYIVLLLQAGFVKNAKNVAQKALKYVEHEMGIKVQEKIDQIFHSYHIDR